MDIMDIFEDLDEINDAADDVFIQTLNAAAGETVIEQILSDSSQYDLSEIEMPHGGLLPPPLPHDMRDELMQILGISNEAQATILSLAGIKSASDFAQLDKPENKTKFEHLAKALGMEHRELEGYVKLPSESAPFGHFDEHEKNTIADPIDDLDAFADRVSLWEDPDEQFDESDEVRKLEWAVLASVPGQAIKLSGLFADKAEAREQAVKASHDNLFDAWVVPVGRFFPFGPAISGRESVASLAHDFAKHFNARIDTMKRRVENKDAEEPAAEPEAEPAAAVEAAVEAEAEPPQEDVDTKILRKMKACLSRGDNKGMRVTGQRHVVLGHMQVEYGKSYLLAVLGAYESAEEASRRAKALSEIPPMDMFGTEQRVVDYVTGGMYEWKPFPFDFMSNVEKTHAGSKNLEKLMQSSMYRQSTEYKSAVKNLQKFHEERERYEKEYPALPAPASGDAGADAGASTEEPKKSENIIDTVD